MISHLSHTFSVRCVEGQEDGCRVEIARGLGCEVGEGWSSHQGEESNWTKLETSVLNDSRFVCVQFQCVRWCDGVWFVYGVLDHCLQVNGPGKTEIYHTKAMGLKASMLQVWLWSLGPVWLSEEAAVKAAEAKAGGIEDIEFWCHEECLDVSSTNLTDLMGYDFIRLWCQ